MTARRVLLEFGRPGAPSGYHFLISAVVPRPIAWISTVDREGRPNLAPFSFFQGVSGDPPVIMVSFFPRKRSGEAKDTLSNIEETGEFVVNGVNEDLLEKVVLTSREYAHGVNEIELASLSTFPAAKVAPPCLAEAPFSLECRREETVEIGGCRAVFGRVLCAHVREDLMDDRGRIDPRRLRPVARLGGSFYAFLGTILEKRG
ncbi:MAG: flavin reductase family protein [Acidobacteria bacterium]|nr:MAG: flavin reductase family protein [Acidobacteriota bacterium]